VVDNPGVDAPQPISPRQRLQTLLAIPERQRTEAEWDEINELEIKLASGNRQDNQQQGPRRNAPNTPGHPRPPGGPQGKKHFRQFHKRRPNRGSQ
jgi:hypothetical protein